MEPTDFEWTDEKYKTVRRMWKDGAKMSAIAATIGCSRNAVAGAITRLGLPRKSERPNMQTINARAARMQDEPPALPVERHIPRQYVAPEATRKTLQELAESDCRWPCWNNDDDTKWFCGAPKAEGAYCGAHAWIGYAHR